MPPTPKLPTVIMAMAPVLTEDESVEPEVEAVEAVVPEDVGLLLTLKVMSEVSVWCTGTEHNVFF